MKKYRKKPVVVEAVQFDGSVKSAHEIAAWANSDRDGVLVDDINVDFLTFKDKVEDLRVHNDTDGDVRVSVDNWIIKGIAGEFYPCKPDIFEAMYELVIDAEASN